MKTLSYTVGEIKQVIKESSNEFKAKLGKNVETDNRRNNDKSYKESEKRTKDYDGGLKDSDRKLPKRTDANMTLMDYNPVTEPDSSYKKKVNAQIEGYSSELEKKNKSKKNANFDGNEEIKKDMRDSRDIKMKERENLESSGLVARELPKSNFKKNTLSENRNMAKRLIFKHTKFLNENNMLEKIPDEYKVDGQRIYTKDGYGNEYIVECTQNSMGVVETNVVGYQNKDLVNERVDRMFELMRYDNVEKSEERNYHTNVNEGKTFNDLMNKVRGIL